MARPTPTPKMVQGEPEADRGVSREETEMIETTVVSGGLEVAACSRVRDPATAATVEGALAINGDARFEIRSTAKGGARLVRLADGADVTQSTLGKPPGLAKVWAPLVMRRALVLDGASAKLDHAAKVSKAS